MITWLRGARGGDRIAAAAVLACAAFLGACTGSASSAGPSPTASTRPSPSRAAGQIAFAAGTPDRRHEQIYLERADGSNVRQLVHSDASDTDPAISPDGRRLAFTRHAAGAPDRIFIVGTDGSGLAQLVPSGCTGMCSDAVEGPAWSPDGRTLVFVRTAVRRGSTAGSGGHLWTVDVGSRAARRVTQPPADSGGARPGAGDGFAGWSPDGTRILYTHHEPGLPPNPDQSAVWIVRPDGTGRREVTPNDIQAGDAVWSPDGTVMAFLSPPGHEDFPKVAYTMRLDGSGMTPLTANIDANDWEGPAWAPDGAAVVVSHVAPGSWSGADLYVVAPGARPRPIAVTPLDEIQPSWGVEPA